ncbi:Alstrom syndrome protein 1, partial [Operophtera brumata]
MIERRAKSTKILVNPACSDVCTSDDSNRSNANSKWNGKKKRLKPENGHKNVDRFDKNHLISRNEAKKDKKSVSCFKIKSSEDKRSDEDGKSGKENCKNENASNLWSSEKPDVISHLRKKKEVFVDE